MSIAAVVLAAGTSSRLGRPKQDIVLNGETLLERSVRAASEAACVPVVVIVSDAARIDELQQFGTESLLNRRSFEGMATSIVAGVKWAKAKGAEGVVLMTCDQPAVTAEHLRALMADTSRVTGSAYAGRIGVPAYFPASSFGDLLALRGDQGARELLRGVASVANEQLALDIDTEADFAEAQRLIGNHG